MSSRNISAAAKKKRKEENRASGVSASSRNKHQAYENGGEKQRSATASRKMKQQLSIISRLWRIKRKQRNAERHAHNDIAAASKAIAA